jgi:tetratricopeptide (TPR) repeat protein
MSAVSYRQHPVYQAASQHFQKGEWKAGLTELDKLIRHFPHEPEIRSLRNEYLFKERLDTAETGDRAAEERQKLRRALRSVVALSMLAAVAFVTLYTYSTWVERQLSSAGARVQHEIQVATLAAKRLDAQALMQVGRLDEAEQVLGEIAQLDPTFDGLAELRTELATERGLAGLYELAMRQIDGADWLGARASLEQLAAQRPNYRDAGIQLIYIDRQTLLGNLLRDGEAALAKGDWSQAVGAFESVRTLHPQHEPEYVEARLFESYVNAARSVLIGQEDSLVALQQAEAYFREGLALRPQDAEIKREREFAGLYLQAQTEFDQGNWNEVIKALTLVTSADPAYAQGTARQTLYDAYIARGEEQMAGHLYEGALNDFERAVALAEQDERSSLRLYEGELKLAEAYGLTGNFEAAVVHYRTAVEWGDVARLGADRPALLGTLQEAEAYAARGNFGVAFERYQWAVRLARSNQAVVVHVVEPGEYLTLLASRYRSTVRAIAQANGIANLNLIFPGQELLIPTLP